jgi:hypothetical protein
VKVSPLVLLPVLILSLALLPASKGELSILKTEAAAAGQKVASLVSSQSGPATERPVQVAKAMTTAKRSAKELKAQRQA